MEASMGAAPDGCIRSRAMCVNLDSLDLTDQQRGVARDQIRERAYHLWEKAGRPPGDGMEFWLAAEAEWIGHYYVPPRPLEWDTDGEADAVLESAHV
jgi:hypothetical protein